MSSWLKCRANEVEEAAEGGGRGGGKADDDDDDDAGKTLRAVGVPLRGVELLPAEQLLLRRCC